MFSHEQKIKIKMNKCKSVYELRRSAMYHKKVFALWMDDELHTTHPELDWKNSICKVDIGTAVNAAL